MCTGNDSFMALWELCTCENSSVMLESSESMCLADADLAIGVLADTDFADTVFAVMDASPRLSSISEGFFEIVFTKELDLSSLKTEATRLINNDNRRN